VFEFLDGANRAIQSLFGGGSADKAPPAPRATPAPAPGVSAAGPAAAPAPAPVGGDAGSNELFQSMASVGMPGPAAAPAPSAAPEAGAPEPRHLPSSPAEAEAMRASGEHFSNAEIRENYVAHDQSLGTQNDAWKEEGVSAEDRAHRAYDARFNMRQTSRAMMESPLEVMLLKTRDLFKYGHTSGPTFDQLVQQAHGRGQQGDDAFESIISSSQRTNDLATKLSGARPGT
jgi:hypothetical protein